MKILVLVFTSILMASTACAKSWRGIVPLHSTCQDVKRLLGHTTCTSDSYSSENERVFIRYSKKRCAEHWDVPKGTVLSIVVYPKIKPKFVDISEGDEKYTKTTDFHLPDVLHYSDEKEGVTLDVFSDGIVSSFYYGPTADDMKLRCATATSERVVPGEATKFDEFKKLGIKEEKIRLGYFAIQLREAEQSAYIVVHSRRAKQKEAQAIVTRIRKYLIQDEGLPANRIIVADGSETKHFLVELYTLPKGTPIP